LDFVGGWSGRMIPEFTEQGLLPEGVHRATIDEFEQRFVYFDRSDRRFRIFDGLRRLYNEASNSGIVRRLLVGGSYVTSEPEPNDFDCILVIDASVQDQNLPPVEYNLVSPDAARRIFRGDVFPLIEGTPKMESLIEFFQRTRRHEPVGIVEIEL
jgi:hypothetical protein